MIIEKLDGRYYTEFEHEIVLTEQDANVDYMLKVRLKPQSLKGIYIDLPKIKTEAGYLQKNQRIATPPKDCDAIIVDVDSKTVYLIEMKKTSSASTNTEISAQLDAGHIWWNHIYFCTGASGHYRIVKIAMMVEERRSRNRRKKEPALNQTEELPFLKGFGNSLRLELY